MRWAVNYRKGSFILHEVYACRDEATRRLLVLKDDKSVWSVEVHDTATEQSQIVSDAPGIGPAIRDASSF